MVYILIYFVTIVLIILVLYRKFKVRSEEFFVYKREGREFEVGMSLVALVFGASSVFGLAGWGYKIGWNSIWWTLSGVVFLVLLGVFFVNVIYSFRGFNIIDTIQKDFGNEIKVISSIILFISWVSVLSGQIIAGGNITQSIVGDRTISFIIFSMIFGIYTIFWGQVGAIKTSFFQVILMVIGIFVILFISMSKTNYNLEVFKNAEIGFNENFSFSFWLTLFISVGLSYLFGPDVYTRIFSSKDSKTAKKAILIASVLILFISILIVSIGIVGREIVKDIDNPDNLIPILSTYLLPKELEIPVKIALISIPLSGADVILITLTSLISKNILSLIFGEKEIFKNIWVIRVIAILSITISTYIAIVGKSIIPMLLTAYKIFSSTVVPIIFISILSKMLNIEIKVNSVKKIIISLLLVLSSSYIVLAELVQQTLRFQNYNLYILGIMIISIGILVFSKNYTRYRQQSLS